MAEAFFQIVLEKLSSLVEGEIGLIMGVDEEMNKLSSTLTTIQAVLEDAEIKQMENRAIQNWLIKLKDLTYEIDDILDECATEASKLDHKYKKSSLYSLKKILFQRKIGRRVKKVTEKLDAVAAERLRFHLTEMTIERPTEVSAIRETGSVLNESHHVYGREEDTEKIVDILINHVKDNEGISVLPIIGVGGLGKTTLAQLVFKDQRVIENFDKRLWVCVSENFDLKTLVKTMIESATGSAPDSLHLDTLQRRLWELLNHEKYLLVLDDVWNEHQVKWSEFRNVLACGATGSSIILTTRLKKVSVIMGTLPAHSLSGLSEEHCWMLLREHAFGQEVEKFPSLEAIGKQIVKKCAGVPLAAKALGSLLRFKRTEKDWIYVKESKLWELPQDETLILPALKLSYHHLPLELRQCFAYCAVFPKDSRIDKEELIFNWMAHGYISSKGVLQVEDVGNGICNELVLRSLLQYVPGKKKTSFIMHDLIHDLAQSIIENKIPGTHVQRNVTIASNSKIRQVNLEKKSIAFPTSKQPELNMSFVLKNFSRLRILDASWTRIKDLPSGIGNLTHLRHLNLSKTGIHTLPDSLCSLRNLQVLNLDECKELVSLPKKMRYLINLRHLFLEECRSLREMPSKIREMTCLRTLSQFIVGHNKGNRLDELQWLNLGGKLTISHLERVEITMDARKANLAEKKHLHVLSLKWENHENASKSGEEIDEKVLEALKPHPNLEELEISGFRGRCFPVWMSNSSLDQKLVRIEISDCQNCLHLPQLGELPHLKSLYIHNVAVEYIIEGEVQSGNGLSVQFSSLETLHLESLPNLKGLFKDQVMSEAFTNLQKLNIEDCTSFILPPLSSLKKLERLGCSSLTLVSLSPLYNLTSLRVKMDKNMTCIPIEVLQNLSNLEELRISGAHEFSLPEEGMQAFKSLKKLEICNCETLACLPESWLQHLNALEKLQISLCQELVELPEGIKYLNHLKRVQLYDLPKMACLPKALQDLYSLQYLKLFRLDQLKSLPEWLDNLTSLESLYIYECPKLESLPASIQGMSNLKNLSILGCPELKRRCERGKGEDWHNIAHIPDLYNGYE